MTKPEIRVECNEGTKYKVVFDKKNEIYTLYYKNNTKPLRSINGGKVKGEWLYLESQPNYFEVLSFLYEEISEKDAVEGV